MDEKNLKEQAESLEYDRLYKREIEGLKKLQRKELISKKILKIMSDLSITVALLTWTGLIDFRIGIVYFVLFVGILMAHEDNERFRAEQEMFLRRLFEEYWLKIFIL